MQLRVPPLAAAVLMAISSFAIAAPSAQAAESSPHNACSNWVNIDGFSDTLDKAVTGDATVSELSGLSVDANGQILAVADESRLFTLDSRTKRPVSVLPLVDENGQPLDSEAVAVDRDGTRLVTSETEPSILRYTRTGKFIGRLPVPSSLQVAPAGKAADNLTFEGMALLPGADTLVASMEGSLTGDSAVIRRLQTWRRAGNSSNFRVAAQYGFQADAGLNISDIASAGDGRLLVLERGYTPGVGNTARLSLADPRRASDVSRVDALTGQPGVRLVSKTLLADIADCPSLGATTKQPQPNPLLDNIEGVTAVGHTSDGRLKLLLVSDDNGNATQITRLYELTVRLPRS